MVTCKLLVVVVLVSISVSVFAFDTNTLRTMVHLYRLQRLPRGSIYLSVRASRPQRAQLSTNNDHVRWSWQEEEQQKREEERKKREKETIKKLEEQKKKESSTQEKQDRLGCFVPAEKSE